MRRTTSRSNIRRPLAIIPILLVIVMIYMSLSQEKTAEDKERVLYRIKWEIENDVYQGMINTYMPQVLYEEEEKSIGEYTMKYIGSMFPVFQYAKESTSMELKQESNLGYEEILAREATDESYIDDTGNLVQSVEKSMEENEAKRIDVNRDKLNDYDYLIQNFYRVDRTTTITAEQLKASTLMAKDMTIDNEIQGPKILIYHTHSQEGYVDSDGTSAMTVVGVGEYLTKLLQEVYGIQVLHHTGEYDKESRDTAYSLAGPAVQQILSENPSVQVVIDLHRDGVAEGTRLVTTVNGKETAKIMFFNGLSRTTTTGDIAYLYNPYIEDNLALSMQMQIAAAERYPEYTRPVYLKGYRYNMHLCPKTLLIEVGAQTNTFAEAKNAMEPLAHILSQVLLPH